MNAVRSYTVPPASCTTNAPLMTTYNLSLLSQKKARYLLPITAYYQIISSNQ